MRTKRHFINKVEMIECDKLDDSMFIPDKGVILSADLVFSKLDTIGLSSLEISDTIESKTTIHNHVLTSYLPSRFVIGNKKFAFLVTDHRGHKIIIGNHSRPYPVITFDDNRPDDFAVKNAVKMTVNYLSTTIYPVL